MKILRILSLLGLMYACQEHAPCPDCTSCGKNLNVHQETLSEAIERKTILYLDKILDSERGQQVHQDFLASGEDVEAGVVNNLMLGSMLKALTPRQREVYLLVEIEGHKVVEAADVLGMRRELAQIELGKARKVVAELREEFGN